MELNLQGRKTIAVQQDGDTIRMDVTWKVGSDAENPKVANVIVRLDYDEAKALAVALNGQAARIGRK